MRIVIVMALAVLFGFPSPGPLQAAEDVAEKDPLEIKDERVKAAYELRLRIEQQELEMAEQLEELFRVTESALEGIDAETLENVQPTLDGLAEIARRLQDVGEQLVLEYGRYKNSHGSYRVMIQNGPETYLAAAGVARDWAKQATEQAYKEEYIRMAETWEAIASHLTERANALQIENAELEETVHFLERTNTFLGRFRQHVLTLPSLDSIVERQKYLDRLKGFIQSVEEFRGLFHKLHNDLTSNATNAALRTGTTEDYLVTVSPGDGGPEIRPDIQTAGFGTNACAIVIVVAAIGSTFLGAWRLSQAYWRSSPGEHAFPQVP